eukprot:m51a1_g8060 hypothetical protein (389) ;mRNA; r:135345-137259
MAEAESAGSSEQAQQQQQEREEAETGELEQREEEGSGMARAPRADGLLWWPSADFAAECGGILAEALASAERIVRDMAEVRSALALQVEQRGRQREALAAQHEGLGEAIARFLGSLPHHDICKATPSCLDGIVLALGFSDPTERAVLSTLFCRHTRDEQAPAAERTAANSTRANAGSAPVAAGGPAAALSDSREHSLGSPLVTVALWHAESIVAHLSIAAGHEGRVIVANTAEAFAAEAASIAAVHQTRGGAAPIAASLGLGGRVCIKTVHNTYLSAQPSGQLHTDRTHVLAWEVFSIEAASVEGAVHVRGAHGKYIGVYSRTGAVTADHAERDDWATFVPEARGGCQWVLRTTAGRYLSVGDTLNAVTASKTAAGAPETFTVLRVPG